MSASTQWRSQYSRHKHLWCLEKVTVGRLSGLTCYHWRCADAECNWSTWCYKHEFWNTQPDPSDPVVDAEGYHVWPNGTRTWPGPGPQPDRAGMTSEEAQRILQALSAPIQNERALEKDDVHD